ncbi:MAG: putative signal peptide protein [Nevskia sp.]|nr:putative signal peptide protein [Nevskia sp.]
MFCASAAAQAETYQDWFVSGSPDQSRVLAITSNDGGAALVIDCVIRSKACGWRLVSDWLCEDGATYSVLANANSHATMVHAICERTPSGLGRSRLSFQEFDAMNALFKGADKVGFAIARTGDQFNLLRFSLSGEPLAQAKLMALINPARTPRSVNVKEPTLASAARR